MVGFSGGGGVEFKPLQPWLHAPGYGEAWEPDVVEDEEEIRRRVFVGGLSQSVTTADLRREMLKHMDGVVDVKIIEDRFNRASKGYGFVTFAAAWQAHACIAEGSVEINGRKLNFSHAKRRLPPQNRARRRPSWEALSVHGGLPYMPGMVPQQQMWVPPPVYGDGSSMLPIQQASFMGPGGMMYVMMPMMQPQTPWYGDGARVEGGAPSVAFQPCDDDAANQEGAGGDPREGGE